LPMRDNVIKNTQPNRPAKPEIVRESS